MSPMLAASQKSNVGTLTSIGNVWLGGQASLHVLPHCTLEEFLQLIAANCTRMGRLRQKKALISLCSA